MQKQTLPGRTVATMQNLSETAGSLMGFFLLLSQIDYRLTQENLPTIEM